MKRVLLILLGCIYYNLTLYSMESLIISDSQINSQEDIKQIGPLCLLRKYLPAGDFIYPIIVENKSIIDNNNVFLYLSKQTADKQCDDKSTIEATCLRLAEIDTKVRACATIEEMKSEGAIEFVSEFLAYYYVAQYNPDDIDKLIKLYSLRLNELFRNFHCVTEINNAYIEKDIIILLGRCGLPQNVLSVLLRLWRDRNLREFSKKFLDEYYQGVMQHSNITDPHYSVMQEHFAVFTFLNMSASMRAAYKQLESYFMECGWMSAEFLVFMLSNRMTFLEQAQFTPGHIILVPALIIASPFVLAKMGYDYFTKTKRLVDPRFHFKTDGNRDYCVSRRLISPESLALFSGTIQEPCRVAIDFNDFVKVCYLAREFQALKAFEKSREEVHEYFLTNYEKELLRVLGNINKISNKKLLSYVFALTHFSMPELRFLGNVLHIALLEANDDVLEQAPYDQGESFLRILEREVRSQRSLFSITTVFAKRWNFQLLENLNQALAIENMASVISSQGISPAIFSTPTCELQAEAMQPLVDTVKGWFIEDINPCKEAKRRMALTFLQVSKPYAFHKGVLDERSWKDLELFCGQRSHAAEYILASVPTFTEIGKVFMMRKVANSSSSIPGLKQEQSRMKALIKNSGDYEELIDAFRRLSENENGLFSFWNNQSQLLKSLDDMLFHWPQLEKSSSCAKNTCDWLNANTASLEFLERWAQYNAAMGTPIAALVKMIFGFVEGKPETVPTKDPHKEVPNPTVKAEKGLKGAISGLYSVATYAQAKVSSAKAGISFVESISAADDFFSQFSGQMVYMGFLRICLRHKLTLVAKYFAAVQDIHRILGQINEDGLFTEFLGKLDFAGLSEQMRNLREKLLAPTFQGDACLPRSGGEAVRAFGYCTGRIVAACNLMRNNKNDLIPMIEAIADLDVLLSSARLVSESPAHSRGFCFPEIVNNTERPCIDIKGSWNPAFAHLPKQESQSNMSQADTEQMKAYIESASKVVPNDLSMNSAGNGPRAIIINGPNAGGKSSIMKAICIAIIFAQSLCIAPATSLRFTPFAKIRAYLNITDDQIAGKSLFKASVERAFEILNTIEGMPSGQFSLCIFDEIFNGTNTGEGEAAAFAILEQLGLLNHTMTLATTHFESLLNLAKVHPTIFANYKVSVKELAKNKLAYPFKLEPGISNQKIAFNILENEGFDEKFMARCKSILAGRFDAPPPLVKAKKTGQTSNPVGANPDVHETVIQHHKKTEPNPIGFNNMGATCYMNGILQICCQLEEFNRNLALMKPQYEAESCAIDYLTFIEQTKKAKAAFIPSVCRTALRERQMKPFDHDDAYLFLIWLLEQLSDNNLLPKYKTVLYPGTKQPRSALSDLFFIAMDCHYRLPTGGGKRHKVEWLSSLDLAILANTLEGCLKRFMYEDVILDNLSHKKQVNFITLPQYLFLNLKRTSFKEGILIRDDSQVQFSTNTLVLKEKQVARVYNLKAFIMHSGTAQLGHYIAFVKRNNKWYECNDAYVKEISEEIIKNIGTEGSLNGFIPTVFVYEKNS